MQDFIFPFRTMFMQPNSSLIEVAWPGNGWGFFFAVKGILNILSIFWNLMKQVLYVADSLQVIPCLVIMITQSTYGLKFFNGHCLQVGQGRFR